MAELFAAVRPRRVIHLAAQAGVRYSLENPATHIKSNLVGIEHLVYASSRSVYGGNSNLPFQERQPVNHPVSLNAATKKGGELRPTPTATCMGCRPDMAPMLFAKAILAGEPIRVFNQGRMCRDFTYIDDIVTGVIACADKPTCADPSFDTAAPDPATSWAPHRLFNIGNSQPVQLLYFIDLLERALGRQAIRDLQPMQPGDVEATAADTSLLEAWVGFRPSTSIEVGVERFARWYQASYA